MKVALLVLIPLVAFFGAALVIVGVVAGLVPWLGTHGWAAWMQAPWFPALVKMGLLLMVIVMPIASLLTWMERKESAMMQDRVGPNRAKVLGISAWGILHFVADAVKMMMKEDFVPAKANKVLFALAPFLAIVPVFIVFAIVPFGADACPEKLFTVITDASCAAPMPLQVARLDVGLLFYFAIASLAVYGTTLAGWASYNKWSLLGGLRASAQMMSYEVTMGLALLGAFLVFGTLEPSAIVEAQGSNPLHWGIVSQPLGALLFFTAAIAETKRAPFDTPEGESEILGYFVEYSGMRFGTFFLAEFVEIVFLSTMMTTIFFGGYHFPGLEISGLSIAGHHIPLNHFTVLVLQTTVFGFKVIFFCWLQIMIRWTLPRIRPDQLMDLGWKKLLPISIANLVITASVVLALQARG